MPRLTIALFVLASRMVLAQDNSASLAGKIEYPPGPGIGGAIVTLDSETAQVHQQAQSNAEGAYRFSGLPAGTYLLEGPSGFMRFKAIVSLSAGEQKSLPAVSLLVSPSGDCFPDSMDPERTKFLPDPAKGALAGHVEKASAPVVGVWVTVQRVLVPGHQSVIGVKTDLQGNFSLTNLAPGRYSLGIGEMRKGMSFSVVGGVESWYSFKLDPVPPNPNPPKLVVCE